MNKTNNHYNNSGSGIQNVFSGSGNTFSNSLNTAVPFALKTTLSMSDLRSRLFTWVPVSPGVPPAPVVPVDPVDDKHNNKPQVVP